MRRAVRLAVFAAALAAAGACARPDRGSATPPVILIVVDTLRADHLPAYGYRGVETPALDGLRRASVLYENAYCHVPLTLPSHASLLTGLLPYEHGVRDNAGFRLDPAHETLAKRLKERGYATGAAVSTYALRRDRGLDAGFDFYDDRLDPASPEERPGPQTVAALEGWMSGHRGEPLFAFLHLFEPHTPYAPPEPWLSRYATSPYDGEIAAADAAVGGFLEHLRREGLFDPALIVFLSDHGEGLDDHGEDEHGVFLYRESIRVPLLVKYPGGKWAGRTVADPVALVDIFPTVSELTGTAAAGEPGKGSGFSLARGPGAVAKGRRIYSETLHPRLALGWSDLASLIEARYQYIQAPRPELYDLSSDPGEKRNLAAGRPPAMRTLKIALDSLQRPPPSSGSATREEVEKLGALGYIRVDTASPEDANLPDPKDRVAALKRLKKLFDLSRSGHDVQAIALGREILETEGTETARPVILSVSRIVASSLERTGNRARAAEILRAALARSDFRGTSDDLSQTYEQLAAIRRRLGDAKGAEQALREAVSRGVAGPEARSALAKLLIESGRAPAAMGLLSQAGPPVGAEERDLYGVALVEAGRLEEARVAFLGALEADPRNASASFHLGLLSLRQKDPASARAWLERSLSVEPRAPGTLFALGLAQAGLGDETGALTSWKQAVELDPTQYDALFNLAILAGRTGRAAEARRALERYVATAPPEKHASNLAEARRLLRALPPS